MQFAQVQQRARSVNLISIFQMARARVPVSLTAPDSAKYALPAVNTGQELLALPALPSLLIARHVHHLMASAVPALVRLCFHQLLRACVPLVGILQGLHASL